MGKFMKIVSANNLETPFVWAYIIIIGYVNSAVSPVFLHPNLILPVIHLDWELDLLWIETVSNDDSIELS